MTTRTVSGLIAAPHTPMRADGSLHLDVIDKLAERFVRGPVDGVFPCGTTGEFPSLTVEERMQVAERWSAVAARELKVIVHVGANCLADCQALAAHARSVGASAIAAIAPFFFRPLGVEDLVDFCAEVATSAPDLPFFYYHLPALSGVDLPMRDFLEAARNRVPSLDGIKYSDMNLTDLGRCVELDGGRFTLLFGVDEALLSALALGVAGAVGTTYCFAATLAQRILRSFESGDLEAARREQLTSMEMVSIFERFGGHPAMKAAMKISGIDCGPVRPPLRSLTESDCAALREELEAIGFDEICSR